MEGNFKNILMSIRVCYCTQANIKKISTLIKSTEILAITSYIMQLIVSNMVFLLQCVFFDYYCHFSSHHGDHELLLFFPHARKKNTIRPIHLGNIQLELESYPVIKFLILCWFTRLVCYEVFGTKQQQYQIVIITNYNSFTVIFNWNKQDQSVSTKLHFSVKYFYQNYIILKFVMQQNYACMVLCIITYWYKLLLMLLILI